MLLAVCCIVAWIFGICISGYLAPNILVFILAAFLLAATLLTYQLIVPKSHRNRAAMAMLAKVLLCVLLFVGGNCFYRYYEESLSQKAAEFCRENPQTLRGVVVSEVQTYDGTCYFYLKADNGLKVSVKVRCQTPILSGQRLVLQEPTLTPVNPANTQILTTRKLMGNGAFLAATFPYEKAVTVEGVANPILYGGKLLRNATADCFNQYFSPKIASFLTALISSDKSDLPDELYEDFITTGTIHIVVVSGMHFNYLMGALLWGLSFLFPSRRKRLIISTLILSLFVCYTGATLPVLRSFLMLSVTFVCDLFYWKPGSKQLTLIFMVGLFLCLMPTLIYNPSFLLSFGAALGLTIFSEPLEKRLSFLSWKGIRSYLTTYLGVQVFTLPVILFYFARMPLVSILTNFLVGPMVAPILILAVLTLGVCKIPVISHGIVWIETVLSSLFLWLVTLTARIPISLKLPIKEFSFLLLLISVSLLAVSVQKLEKSKKLILRSFCILCLMGALIFRTGLSLEHRILVTFFGTSNNNSAAITTEKNHLVLYTSGNDLLYGQSTAAYRDFSQIELLILTDVSNPEFISKFLDSHRVKQVVIPAKYRSELPKGNNITFLEQSVTTHIDSVEISVNTDGETIWETQVSYLGQTLSFTQNASYLEEHITDDSQKAWIFNFRRTSQAARNISSLPIRNKLFSKKEWHPDVKLCNNYSMIQVDRGGIYPLGATEQEP